MNIQIRNATGYVPVAFLLSGGEVWQAKREIKRKVFLLE